MGPMSQRELARRTGVSPKHVCCILGGTARISVIYALALEYALSVPAQKFIDAQSRADLWAARCKLKKLEQKLERRLSCST